MFFSKGYIMVNALKFKLEHGGYFPSILIRPICKAGHKPMLNCQGDLK